MIVTPAGDVVSSLEKKIKGMGNGNTYSQRERVASLLIWFAFSFEIVHYPTQMQPWTFICSGGIRQRGFGVYEGIAEKKIWEKFRV